MDVGRPQRIALFASALACSILASLPALAAEVPAVQLTYVLGEGAQDCPDDADLRAAVRTRLGFDPFRDRAELALQASVTREGEVLTARLLLASPSEPPGERTLRSVRSDCSELASALALAIALAIDPLSVSRPPPASPPIPPPPPPLPPPPPPAQAPAPWPKQFHARLGLLGAIGSEPSPTAGLAAGVGVRVFSVSLSLEGRADLSGSKSVGGGRVSGFVGAASLVPCYHLAFVSGCAVASLGALRSAGEDLAGSRQATSLYGALGARAALELPAQGRLRFHAHLDILVPVVRNTYLVGDAPVWSSSPVAGVLGLGLLIRL